MSGSLASTTWAIFPQSRSSALLAALAFRVGQGPWPTTRREKLDGAVFDFRTGLFYCDCQMKKASWFFWAFVGLVWLVISLPFSGDSLKALFDIPDTPPSSQDELGKLLQNITYAANFSILSILVLYGLNRGWHETDGYPKWLHRLHLQARFTNLFQSKLVLAATNTVLALLALVFSILLFFHGRMLVAV